MAIALGSVLVVSVLVVLTQLMAGAQKSNDLASGSILAERLLTDTASSPGLAPGTRQGTVRPTVSSEATQEFHYNVDVRPVDVTNPDAGNSFLLTVDVWWMSDDPNQNRAGVGKLSVKMSRVVYRSEATPQP